MNRAMKCQFCGKIFLDYGHDECPYCHAKLNMSTFEMPECFKDIFPDLKGE